jgi:hypothetical protein
MRQLTLSQNTQNLVSTVVRRVGIAIITLFLWSQATFAANNGVQLLGKWVENLSNGGTMIVEFTETTLSFTPIDASGRTLKPTNTSEVTFKQLGISDAGESISITFKDKNGNPSGGILAIVKSENKIVLDFPGVGVHLLTRAK